MTIDRSEPTRAEKVLSMLSVPLVVLITLVGVGVAVAGPDLVSRLKIIAVSAGVIGAISAGLTLWAHKGSDVLDGIAKMLGFSAANLAAIAAFVLLSVELIIAPS
ncbi:hypothetical protein C1N74_16165 (plasmid) [Microbacterium sp. SGAir0570]|uniref:hypothetical protein n=1 Tax=Microbacterium sp. SGAir0570 TaxID=2070348 RepID=UPI0010CCEF30|nr:hypothetical protein [Microbacterium sp. SGAir0570]QCR42122.1 hypothetical protein C1N74_16165 [Microbacterium sp. SGAir0570]